MQKPYSGTHCTYKTSEPTDPPTMVTDLTKAHLKYEPRYPTMFLCLHSDRISISCCMMSKSSPLSSGQTSLT